MFVTSLNILRDLSVYRNCQAFSLGFQGNALITEAQIYQGLLFSRLLVSALREAFTFLRIGLTGEQRSHQKVRTANLSAAYELDSEAQAALGAARQFFRERKEFVEIVRNQLTFHYDYDRAVANLPALEGEDDGTVFFARDHNNAYYPFAEERILRCVVEESGFEWKDRQKATIELVRDVCGLSDRISDVLGEFVYRFTRKHLGMREMSRGEAVRIVVPRVDRARLPRFVAPAPEQS